jgi:predicted metal-dependent HD superfamily phosphohydrolase
MHATIERTEDGFSCSDGPSIRWDELRAVGIHTTEDGPWLEDVFWWFLSEDGLLEIPNGAVEGEVFEAITHGIPGLDLRKLILAMGSTDERVFGLWHAEPPSRPPREELESRLVDLLRRLGATQAPEEVTCALLEAWGGDERRYHDLQHLSECLGWLDASPIDDPERDLAELALWWHDAVLQDPEPEARSAEWLLRTGEDLGLPSSLLHRAAQLVRTTAAHDASGDPLAALVSDCDLAILAADPIRFREYEEGVLAEASAHWRLHVCWRRAAILEDLLARPRLFHIPWFHERLEARARGNIEALLEHPRYRRLRPWRRAVVWLAGR